MSKPTVTYFPINGRAFATRAALRYAKVDYNDNRVPGKVFAAEYKQDPAKAPLGLFPVLEIPEEGIFVQSTAHARWAARKSDLYPKDDIAQLIVDEALESINELLYKLPFTAPDEETKKAKRQEWVKTVLPAYMHLLETRIAKSGGPFLLGKKISVADLFIYSQVNMIHSGNLDYVEKDIIEKEYNPVYKLFVAVGEHPIAKAELEAKI